MDWQRHEYQKSQVDIQRRYHLAAVTSATSPESYTVVQLDLP